MAAYFYCDYVCWPVDFGFVVVVDASQALPYFSVEFSERYCYCLRFQFPSHYYFSFDFDFVVVVVVGSSGGFDEFDLSFVDLCIAEGSVRSEYSCET